MPGTKTNKSRRWVPIAAPLLALLREIHPEARTGPLVPPWTNVRRDLRTFVTAYNREQQKLAIKEKRQPPKPMEPFSPNDLRRTFASWLKQAGVDSMIVARLLGHTTSRMVELVYGHLNDATTTRAIEHLPAAAVPTLAQPGTSSADPTKPRRRFGDTSQVPLPPLRLVGENEVPPSVTTPTPEAPPRSALEEPQRAREDRPRYR